MKLLLLALTCGLLLCGIHRIYSFQNGGFCAAKLRSPLTPHLATPPPNVDTLLQQPFHYLGSGGTSFAFLGEDGKTVLKLFKHQHLFQKSYLFHLAFPGMTDYLRIRKILRTRTKHAHKHHAFFFSSCHLAYTQLKEETGLLYLCLRPNPHFTHPIRLIDAWGIAHTIDLAQTEFALQRKADLCFPYLQNLLRTGDKEALKQATSALVHHIRCRCRQGIGDRDPNLLLNFGFIDHKAVEFDLGSFFPDPALQNPLEEAKEVFFSTYTLREWLGREAPELLTQLKIAE
jgi:hypothetical protein